MLKHSLNQSSTIGEKLRSSREMKGFSLQEISRALCLSVQTVDALERDAYEELPAPVFVKGYLKNYANYLQLPLFPETTTLIPEKKFKHSPVLVSWISLAGQLFLKTLNYLVFIILILFVFLWWHERHAAEKEIAVLSLNAQPDILNIIIPEWPFDKGEKR
jgi:cytoskeleton protein RodZ